MGISYVINRIVPPDPTAATLQLDITIIVDGRRIPNTQNLVVLGKTAAQLKDELDANIQALADDARATYSRYTQLVNYEGTEIVLEEGA